MKTVAIARMGTADACGSSRRERDALRSQAQEAQAAASHAAGELKRLRGAAAESELRFGAHMKETQGKLKAAEASLRCGTGLAGSKTCGLGHNAVLYT
jgi:hypothetical protein